MKRPIFLIATLCMLFSTTACAGWQTLEENTLPRSQTLESLPGNMDFSGKTVPLERVTFFESYGNHGYTGYIIVAMSRENLSDDDIHWMTRMDWDSVNTEMSVNVYLDGGKNNLDETARLLKKIYNNEELYYIFETDLERYTFRGAEVGCQIISSPVGITDPGTTYYHYSFGIDGDYYSDSIEVLTASERSALIDALTE